MAVSLATLIAGSIKNMGAVNSHVKDLAVELVRRSYAKGIPIIITDGLRTMEEQARLYGQGRSSYIYRGKQYARSGSVVTQAEPGESVHNYGYAIDFVLILPNGNAAWDTVRDANGIKGSDWFEVAKIGKELGFDWGGDWTWKDYPHLDYGGLTWRQLQAGKRPAIKALAPRNYKMNGDQGEDIEEAQRWLNVVGIEVEEDGYFGDDTETALKLFQGRTGLEKDGLYGEATKAKLKETVLRYRTEEAAKTAAIPDEEEEEITLAEILVLSTNEGKNAQLRVLKRFEKKEPALSKQWREKVEKGEFTYADFAEVFFVAVDRGYITGLVNTDALQEKVEALEKTISEK